MMFASRKSHYDHLDRIASEVARMDPSSTLMTEAVLNTIIELYQSAKVENEYVNELFETAYHQPITSELEFLLARIFYHYSADKGLGWKIYLRRQVKKTAPDIRIELQGRTVGVVEVKAKVGWIQPVFSPLRYQRDIERLKGGQSKYDPDEVIGKARAQLEKYKSKFEVSTEDIFLFLPTLALVHRKKYAIVLSDYYEYFTKTSGLPSENLILLSSSLQLDLSKNVGVLMPTNHFERMIRLLEARTIARRSVP